MNEETRYEELVPSEGLCMKIPRDSFDDTPLMWSGINGGRRVEDAEDGVGVKVAPAPTLKEIFKALHEYGDDISVSCKADGSALAWILERGGNGANTVMRADTLEDAALKLWLKLKTRELQE